MSASWRIRGSAAAYSALWIFILWASAAHADAQTKAVRQLSNSLAVDKRGYENIVPKYDMCEVAFHQAALDGDVLWIHGGYAGYFNGTQSLAPNSLLRRIDLSKPFRLDSRDEAPVAFIPVPDEVPEITSGSLFARNGKLYEVTGHSERLDTNYPGWNDANLNEMWEYNSASNNWAAKSTSDRSGTRINLTEHHYSSHVNHLGKTYIFGGFKIKGDNEEKRQNVVYDFSEDKWTKLPPKFGIMDWGAMIHVPIGPRGILIPLAGHRNPTGDPAAKEMDYTNSALSVIDIFNLNAEDSTSPEGSWSTQKATAANPLAGVPIARLNICAWAVMAPDNSNAQVYMYGGTELDGKNDDHEHYRDLWVLSIPSFQWILLDDGSSGPPNPRASQTNPGQREGHTCHLVRKSTMVMFGGRAPPPFSRACETTGLYAYDLNAGKWVEQYDPEKAAEQYRVPEAVFKVIGGDKDGGGTKTPENGVLDSNLRTLYAEMLTPKQRDPGAPKDPIEIPGPPAIKKPDSPAGPGLPIGALVGIAVGGLLVILAVIFWAWRRRRTSPMYSEAPSAASAVGLDNISTTDPEDKKGADFTDSHGSSMQEPYTRQSGTYHMEEIRSSASETEIMSPFSEASRWTELSAEPVPIELPVEESSRISQGQTSPKM